MKFLYYISLTLLSHIFLPSPFTFEMYSALAKTSSSEVKGSFTIDLNGTNVISRLQYTVRKKYIIVIVESMRNIYTIWQFHCKTSGTNQLSRVFPTTRSRQRRRTQSPAPRCSSTRQRSWAPACKELAQLRANPTANILQASTLPLGTSILPPEPREAHGRAHPGREAGTWPFHYSGECPVKPPLRSASPNPGSPRGTPKPEGEEQRTVPCVQRRSAERSRPRGAPAWARTLRLLPIPGGPCEARSPVLTAVPQAAPGNEGEKPPSPPKFPLGCPDPVPRHPHPSPGRAARSPSEEHPAGPAASRLGSLSSPLPSPPPVSPPPALHRRAAAL